MPKPGSNLFTGARIAFTVISEGASMCASCINIAVACRSVDIFTR